MNTHKINGRALFDKTKEYLYVFSFVLLFFLTVLLTNSVWPFGGNTLLLSDSYCQIGEFFEHIFSVLNGEQSLFYSSRFGGGVEIFSTLMYMFFNPLYLIFLIGGEGNVKNVATIVVFLMFVFNVLTFVWFAKKYFKNISTFMLCLLASLFSVSTFVVLNYGFITWLVSPGYLLLIVDGFLDLIEKKKITKFIIFQVLFVTNCFASGVAANFILILLFSFYIFYVLKKEDRKENYTRLFVAYAIAALISFSLLFPLIYSILKTGRSSLPSSFSYINKSGIVFRIPQLLLIGGLFVVSTILFIESDKKERKTRFFFVSVLLLVLLVVSDYSLRFLFFGFYCGFFSRISFVLETMLFCFTLFYFNKGKKESYPDKQHIDGHRDSFILKFLLLFMMVMSLLAFICIFIFGGNNFTLTLKNPYGDKKITLLSIFVFFVTFDIPLTSYFFYKRKGITKLLFKSVIVFGLIFSLIFNVSSFIFCQYRQSKSSIKQVVNSQQISGNVGFYSSVGEYTNIGFENVRNTSLFSSIISGDSCNTYSKIGYSFYHNEYSPVTANIVLDSILGLKYYVSKIELDDPNLSLAYQESDYFIYENQLASSGAILFDDEIDFSEIENPKDFMMTLQSYYEVDGELFSPAVCEEIETIGSEKKYKFTAEEDCFVVVNAMSFLKDCENFNLKYQFIFDINENACVSFLFLQAGESKEVVYSMEDDKFDEVEFSFLNYNISAEICDKIKQNQAQIEYNKNGFKVSCENSESKKLVVFTPAIEGLNYTDKTEKIELIRVFENFVAFNLDAGSHEIDAVYKCPYAKLWIVILSICLILVLAFVILYRLTKFKHIQKFICYLFFALNVCIVLMIFLLGPIFSIVSIFI